MLNVSWCPCHFITLTYSKGLITLCVVSLAFFLYKTRVKTQVKTRKKREKNARKTREFFSILHYTWGRNTSQLCFSRVFLVFFLFHAHKPYQNAKQKHSVIWVNCHNSGFIDLVLRTLHRGCPYIKFLYLKLTTSSLLSMPAGSEMAVVPHQGSFKAGPKSVHCCERY